MKKNLCYMITGICFYVFAGVFAAYGFWAVIKMKEMVSQALEAGFALKGNEFDIASLYVSNCGQYFVYAMLLVGAGMLLQRVWAESNAVLVVPSVAAPAPDKANDDELEQWFQESDAADSSDADEAPDAADSPDADNSFGTDDIDAV